VLAEFAHVENVYMRLTDRLSYVPQPARYRSMVFRGLLQYWLRFFERETSIGSAFFISAPHMGNDFVAYHAAKRVGLRTIFLERSLITNRILLLEDYDKFEKVPPSLLGQEPIEQVEAAIDPGLLAALRQPSPWSRHSSAINNAVVEGREGKKALGGGQGVSRRAARPSERWLQAARRLFGESNLSATAFEDSTPGYVVQLRKVFYRRRVMGLRMHYEALTQPPESGRYVFFAMHLQPERTTCPQGGVFDDQLYAIETLAKALPDDCRLYVKEHPRQFWPTSLKSRHYRDKDFYTRLSNIPKVRLLPLETPTATMIAGALATATITGSAGWESLLAGKPCLVFGVPWYIPCNSCFAVRTTDDCRQALAASSESSPDIVQRHLLVYLAHVQGQMIHATSSQRFVQDPNEYPTLVRNLAKAIAARAHGAG
jgi:hypothetical protein